MALNDQERQFPFVRLLYFIELSGARSMAMPSRRSGRVNSRSLDTRRLSVWARSVLDMETPAFNGRDRTAPPHVLLPLARTDVGGHGTLETQRLRPSLPQLLGGRNRQLLANLDFVWIVQLIGIRLEDLHVGIGIAVKPLGDL